MDECCSVPITLQEKFLLSKLHFLVVTPCAEFSTYLRHLMRGIIRRTLKFTAYLHLVLSHRKGGGIPVLHSNQLLYLLYRGTENIWHAPFSGYNPRSLSVSSGSDYPFKAKRKLYVPQVRLQKYQPRKA